MEGVVDHNMRRILTDIGGYDRCVTEFIRVTSHPVPLKVFKRLCPELDSGGMTASGTPVFVQLLGGDPDLIAKSALTAVKAGAPGIDLNFGCPTKIVNRHDGGSVLLKYPHRIGNIVSAVRQTIDPAIPVCAKIRLGFENSDYLDENVDHVYSAGASELCIHARTRNQGYKPPAFWSELEGLPRSKETDLVVNGEIWTAENAMQAKAESGCEHIMIGRGGLARPDLAKLIRAQSNKDHLSPLPWQEVVAMVDQFFCNQDSHRSRYAGNRTKQWLVYLGKQYTHALELFKSLKRLTSVDDINQAIYIHRKDLEQLQ